MHEKNKKTVKDQFEKQIEYLNSQIKKIEDRNTQELNNHKIELENQYHKNASELESKYKTIYPPIQNNLGDNYDKGVQDTVRYIQAIVTANNNAQKDKPFFQHEAPW